MGRPMLLRLFLVYFFSDRKRWWRCGSRSQVVATHFVIVILYWCADVFFLFSSHRHCNFEVVLVRINLQKY